MALTSRSVSWVGRIAVAGLLLVVLAMWVRGDDLVEPADPPPPPVLPGQESAVHATVHANGRELVLDFGPFQLPAGADHHELAQPEPATVRIPASGWVHGFRVDVIDARGEVVPSTVLHHVNVIATQHREIFSQIMRRVAAAGRETGPVRLPRLLGYPLPEGDELMLVAMLHNPTAQTYEDVFLRVRLLLTPGRGLLRPVSIYPVYLDVMPPASVHAYDLPPGRSEQSWEGSPVVSGRLLGVGGHLHRYGLELVLEDVTRNRVLWRARPKLDENGEVVGMPMRTFLLRGGIHLRSEHVYRLTAVYDNPTGRTIPLGGMGALGGIFRPTPGERMPAVDPLHPEYLLDNELLHQPYHHGHGDEHEHEHQHQH